MWRRICRRWALVSGESHGQRRSGLSAKGGQGPARVAAPKEEEEEYIGPNVTQKRNVRKKA